MVGLSPALLCAGLYQKGAGDVPDEPPLVLPDPHVPADRSTWVMLEEAVERADDDQDVREVFKGGPPGPEDFGRWTGDAEALERVVEASARSGLAVPKMETWDGTHPDFIPLMDLRGSLRLKAVQQEAEGDVLGAAETLLVALRLGRLFKDGDVDLLAFMVGVTWMDPADLLELSLRHPDHPELFPFLHAQLQTVPLERSAYRVLVYECILNETLLGDEGAFRSLNQEAFSLYSPEDTVAWNRNICRTELDQIAKPLADRVRPPLATLWSSAGPERFVHNPAGRQLMDIAGLDRFHFAEREDRLLVKLGALKVLTALRVGETPSLEDPLGGQYLVSDTEVWSTLDGRPLAGQPFSMRWPRQNP